MSAWSSQYAEMVNRNIGVVSEAQQEQLCRSKVVVLGVGGVGGTAFEVLVRSGIGRFSIVDCDTFEASNLNRQIFALHDTLGQRKIDVATERATAINPDVKVECCERITSGNVSELLSDARAVLLAIDTLEPCLIAARAARRLGIPVIEGWALPYGNVRVINAETPTLEQLYELPTEGRPIDDFSAEELRELGLRVLMQLGQIDGITRYFPADTVERISQGRVPSFAPTVWLTAVLLALETVKVLLAWGRPALGPNFSLYDPFEHRIPSSEG